MVQEYCPGGYCLAKSLAIPAMHTLNLREISFLYMAGIICDLAKNLKTTQRPSAGGLLVVSGRIKIFWKVFHSGLE